MLKKFSILLLMGLLVIGSAIFFRMHGNPIINIIPEHALPDTPIQIIVSGLKSNEQVTLEASCKDMDNTTWKSSATFTADDKGIVDVSKQAPISGSYSGIDPMGLFWSLTSTNNDPFKNTLKAQVSLYLSKVFLSVFSGDKLRAQKVIIRWPDVQRKKIREQGIVGTLFYPKNSKKNPGIITIHGAGGVPDESLAEILASHGYTVFCIAWFGQDGLPKNLSLIPLEYFQNALLWLKKQPQVDGSKIALIGQTVGAELVLLLAALFPNLVDAGIAYSPTSIVTGDHSMPHEQSAWTYKNRPLPFLPTLSDQQVEQGVREGFIKLQKGTIEDPILPSQFSLYMMNIFSSKIEAATIPVEKIRCPILMIAGNDDKQWPSAVYAKSIIERLDSKGSTIKRKYVNYPNAGNHLLTFPYRSSIDLPFMHGSSWTIAGGTAEGNAHAIEQAWHEVLDFLKETLGI